MVEFGELVTVNPGQAWQHEANDFTPWMVQPENLDKLSREVGLPALELEGREVREGSLRADIIAVVPQDDRKVLIENQLYHADFDHLGRTLAYANAFNANIVVWVAGGFSPDHLAAFRWLNEHTKEDVDFFAVQVKVFRIGDSLMAPKFEVLERPNNFIREIRVQQERGESGRHAKFRNDFWMFYSQRHPGDPQLRPDYKGSNVYRKISGLTLSIYLAQNGVGIYIRPDNAEARQLAERCGPVLEERGLIQNWHSYHFKHFDPHNRENWPEMTDWLHDNFVAYREVIESVAAAPVEADPDEIALATQS